MIFNPHNMHITLHVIILNNVHSQITNRDDRYRLILIEYY